MGVAREIAVQLEVGETILMYRFRGLMGVLDLATGEERFVGPWEPLQILGDVLRADAPPCGLRRLSRDTGEVVAAHEGREEEGRCTSRPEVVGRVAGVELLREEDALVAYRGADEVWREEASPGVAASGLEPLGAIRVWWARALGDLVLVAVDGAGDVAWRWSLRRPECPPLVDPERAVRAVGESLAIQMCGVSIGLDATGAERWRRETEAIVRTRREAPLQRAALRHVPDLRGRRWSAELVDADGRVESSWEIDCVGCELFAAPGGWLVQEDERVRLVDHDGEARWELATSATPTVAGDALLLTEATDLQTLVDLGSGQVRGELEGRFVGLLGDTLVFESEDFVFGVDP